MADLKTEFEHYLAQKDEFLAKYRGKFVAIKDSHVLGAYDNRLTAIQETAKAGHEVGTFLVQHVTDVDEMVRFHSRVAL